MAITVDDLPFAGPARDPAEWARVTRALLDCFVDRGVPAVGFVNEGKLGDPPHPRRVAVLQQWLDRGFELGNHTRSHPSLHEVAFERFADDVRAGDRVLDRLVPDHGVRWFRHPFLHTGRDAETRERLDALLRAEGYRVAPVTMDDQDYRVAAAYDAAEPEARPAIAAAYVDYMDAVMGYWEDQSQALLDREMAQILLIHASALNAAACPALLERAERRGYRFIALEEAAADPAYGSQRDEYYGAAGISWLHRWALTEGHRGEFFAGEPEAPVGP